MLICRLHTLRKYLLFFSLPMPNDSNGPFVLLYASGINLVRTRQQHPKFHSRNEQPQLIRFFAVTLSEHIRRQ